MEVGVRWVYEARQAISIQHQSSARLVRHFRLQIEIVENQVRNTAKLKTSQKGNEWKNDFRESDSSQRAPFWFRQNDSVLDLGKLATTQLKN